MLPIMLSERSVALMLYAAFDESDDDTYQSEDEDSEDHDPRRSKRARHGVDAVRRVFRIALPTLRGARAVWRRLCASGAYLVVSDLFSFSLF